jgi:hypothetical protein
VFFIHSSFAFYTCEVTPRGGGGEKGRGSSADGVLHEHDDDCWLVMWSLVLYCNKT